MEEQEEKGKSINGSFKNSGKSDNQMNDFYVLILVYLAVLILFSIGNIANLIDAKRADDERCCEGYLSRPIYDLIFTVFISTIIFESLAVIILLTKIKAQTFITNIFVIPFIGFFFIVLVFMAVL